MIEIQYDREAFSLRARGHSGSAESGKDLVCAGVTVLVLTLRENLLALEKEGLLKNEAAYAQLGKADFRCVPAPEAEAQVDSLFETVMMGLRLLERLFGEFVRIREEG